MEDAAERLAPSRSAELAAAIAGRFAAPLASAADALARLARDTLAAAGAHLVYREIPDLSHTYPRHENPAILAWFAGLPSRA
ncbi:MAG: hypothetical protein IT293_17220 [Deltaproteobacteria bacterium]|nr:hypothetical protein [Deltaproteobacteria bacterium]